MIDPATPHLAWGIPFAALVLTVAIVPVALQDLWNSQARRTAWVALIAAPVVAMYALSNPRALSGLAQEYVSFIVLLGALFVISGGILLEVGGAATPRTNATLLGLGAMLASFVGTTGASMLLVRPLLQVNRDRNHVAHTMVFFIFLVSNIGGCLTPLGDPPLYLGYMAGVGFWWTMRLVLPWSLTVGLLLGVYFLWERRLFAREPVPRGLGTGVGPLRMRGTGNLVYLGAVPAAVALLHGPARDVALLAIAVLSYLTTDDGLRRTNRFTFGPIVEIAILFAGIFVTMLPALEILRTRATNLAVREPWQFFWATGALSSFLDNAPTYRAFLSLAQGLHLPAEVVGVPAKILEAISLGAVFMGANTYIGNGPNLMVRSIAEEHGVKMPSFGGYLLYSGGILLPIFVLVTLIFLR